MLVSFFVGAAYVEVRAILSTPEASPPLSERASCRDVVQASPSTCPHPRHKASVQHTFGREPGVVVLCSCEEAPR